MLSVLTVAALSLGGPPPYGGRVVVSFTSGLRAEPADLFRPAAGLATPLAAAVPTADEPVPVAAFWEWVPSAIPTTADDSGVAITYGGGPILQRVDPSELFPPPATAALVRPLPAPPSPRGRTNGVLFLSALLRSAGLPPDRPPLRAVAADLLAPLPKRWDRPRRPANPPSLPRQPQPLGDGGGFAANLEPRPRS